MIGTKAEKLIGYDPARLLLQSREADQVLSQIKQADGLSHGFLLTSDTLCMVISHRWVL